MPIPKKDAIRDPGAIEVQTVTVEDVLPGIGKDNFGKDYPLRFRIVDKDKNIVSEEDSSGVMKPQNWFKKFYVHKKTGFINYTQGHNYLALLKILETQDKYVPGEKHDVNTLIGFKFDASVVQYDKGRFINWYQTLDANNVEVPQDASEIPGQKSKEEEIKENHESVKDKESQVDSDDLPF